jgi:hypothetical protein
MWVADKGPKQVERDIILSRPSIVPPYPVTFGDSRAAASNNGRLSGAKRRAAELKGPPQERQRLRDPGPTASGERLFTRLSCGCARCDLQPPLFIFKANLHIASFARIHKTWARSSHLVRILASQTRDLPVYIVMTEIIPVEPWMAAHLYGAETNSSL